MAGIDSNTLIYLRGDSFVDLSLNNYTISNSSSIATANSTHFGKAIDFTVASKRLEALDAVLPTNQFTIDWWELSKGASTANTALVTTLDHTHTNTAIKGIIMGKSTNSAAPCLWATTPSQTGTWVVSQTLFGNANTTSWVHRALVYDGANFYAYENGVLFKTMACAGLAAPSPSHIIMGGYRAQTACYNAHVESLRISNNVRWTGDFTPPTKPYTSVTVNVLGQVGKAINFSATKASINEAITRVDVLLNNAVVQSYTSNYDNMSCEFTNLAETNNVEIRAYYYGDYYESKSFNFVPAVEKLESNASLSKIVDKISELQSYYSNINNNLVSYFNDEGVEVAESEKTFSQLISKLESHSSGSGGDKAELEAQRAELNNQIAALTSQVAPLETQVSTLNSQVSSLNSQVTSLNNEQSSAKSTLVSKLTSCGVSASTSTDFNTLLNSIGMAITKGSKNGTGGGSGSGGGSSSGNGFTVTVTNPYTYGFYNSGGMYYNENCDPNDYGDYDSSYAMSKIVISNPNAYTLYFEYIIDSEEGYDIGLLSTRNGSLSASNSVDSTYLLKVSGYDESYVSLGSSTSGTYYVKYRKDGSVAEGSDMFCWRIAR